MKRIARFWLLLALTALGTVGCDSDSTPAEEPLTVEQQNRNYQTTLDEKFASQWTADELRKANTAASADYLSQVEKEVFFYINLARINPVLFARTYAREYSGMAGWVKGYAFSERQASLLAELQALQPLPLLAPNEVLYDSADCFATNGGKRGTTGHDRTDTGCSKNPGLAECAAFGGYVTGLSVVMELLIDSGESNASLGHRRILLNGNYEWMGAAIRTHRDFQYMVVLNLDSRNLQ